MAWDDFVKGLKKGKRKRKDPSELFSETLLINITPIQRAFIEENSKTYGSKANVVRVALNKFIEKEQEQ